MKRIEWKDLKDGQKVTLITPGKNAAIGEIVFERATKYFLTNDTAINGSRPDSRYMKKYEHSWSLGCGPNYCGSDYCEKVDYTAKEIEEYKDFQIGDKLKQDKRKALTVFSNEYIVGVLFCDSAQTYFYSRDYIYLSGWRLDETPVEETPEIKEYTAAEAIKILAEKAGIDESQIRIKK